MIQSLIALLFNPFLLVLSLAVFKIGPTVVRAALEVLRVLIIDEPSSRQFGRFSGLIKLISELKIFQTHSTPGSFNRFSKFNLHKSTISH